MHLLTARTSTGSSCSMGRRGRPMDSRGSTRSTSRAGSRVDATASPIEVAGYCEPTLHVTGEPSFLLAELEADGEVLIATDRSWTGIRLQQKRADVLPFSHARSIMEIYDLDAGYFDWRTSPLGGPGESPWFPVEEVDDDRQLLERAGGARRRQPGGGARVCSRWQTRSGGRSADPGSRSRKTPSRNVRTTGRFRSAGRRARARVGMAGSSSFTSRPRRTARP